MNPQLRRFPTLVPISESTKGERNAAVHRATKAVPHLQHDSSFMSKMPVQRLKTKRIKEKILARELCRDGKAGLGLTGMTRDKGCMRCVEGFHAQVMRNKI